MTLHCSRRQNILFRSFLYRNFKKYEHYDKMLPTLNQPEELYGTAKTHKFDNTADITVDNLKFRPVIAQSGTYTYNVAQVTANYLKPLCNNNEYIIQNTRKFAKIIPEQDPLKSNEQYASYDVESLFTNVPVNETIEYIIKEIYVENKLPKLCSKLIFKRLLLKFTRDTSKLNSKFYKQVDGCSMGGPLSVIFSDIYMTKTERKVVEPTKPQFYKRFVDDIIDKQYKDQPDNLFQALDSNHPKIKYTIEVDPDKFLETKIIKENGIVTTKVNRKDRKLLVHWTSRIPKWYKTNSISSDLKRALRISSCLNDEISNIRNF